MKPEEAPAPETYDAVPVMVVGIVFEPASEASSTDTASVDAPMSASGVDAVVSALRQAGLVAGVLDGEAVGAPGWVLAQTSQFDDGTLGRWTARASVEDRFERVNLYELRSSLEAATGRRVQIGATVALPNGVFEAGEFRGSAPEWIETGVVLGRWQSADAPAMAHTAGQALWFVSAEALSGPASASPAIPYAMVAAAEPGGFLSAATAWPSKGPRIELSRTGPWRRLTVFRRHTVDSTGWGPVWRVVDPSGQAVSGTPDVLVEQALDSLGIGPHDFDAAHLAKILDLHPADADDATAGRLRQLLRSPHTEDPFGEVVRALNLPDVVVDVAEGRRSPENVPGAARHEPEGLLRAIWKGAVTEPAGPGLTNWMHRMWIHRPWSYWLYSVVFGVGLLLVGAAGIAQGSWWPRWVLWLVIGLGVLTLADMLVPRKWRGLEQVSSDVGHG